MGTPGPIATGPLRAGDGAPCPSRGPGEMLVRVEACGVCRTDLHVAEGDLPPHRPSTVPGHEIVGRVVAAGRGATRFAAGDRVGVAWLRGTCGACRYCRPGRENLCPVVASTPAGTPTAATPSYAVAARGLRLPAARDADRRRRLAPLLCAGIIGYRALRRSALPPGGRLGIYGFGASAHLAAQVALRRGRHRARADPVGRGPRAGPRAGRGLGAATPTTSRPSRSTRRSSSRRSATWCRSRCAPRPRRHARRRRHPPQRHPAAELRSADLFQERDLRSVTVQHPRGRRGVPRASPPGSGIRADRRPATRSSRADQALADLAADRVNGAAVLIPESVSGATPRPRRPAETR